MKTLTLKREQVVDAVAYSGWNICLWGNPKLTIICGSCFREFKSRNYYPFNMRTASIVNCPHCGKWNEMNFIMK